MVARDKAIRVDAVCLSDLRDPLFFLISPGLFNASLYDHLNVMLLHVNEQSAAWTARMGILKVEDERRESRGDRPTAHGSAASL
jgi:hypothetical protein